jgi:hypothetical protein
MGLRTRESRTPIAGTSDYFPLRLGPRSRLTPGRLNWLGPHMTDEPGFHPILPFIFLGREQLTDMRTLNRRFAGYSEHCLVQTFNLGRSYSTALPTRIRETKF